MSDKDLLCAYRFEQSCETLKDACLLLESGGSLRSVVNRSYYAVFYAILALFLKFEVIINTSKHSGVITVFDKEFIKTGLIDRKFSSFLHSLFDNRQEFDYREFASIERAEAEEVIVMTEEFIELVRNMNTE